MAQLADAVFHDFPIGLFLIAGVTALILVLAANTAFNGFPVLGSILAQDRYLPRQLHTRGDRLAFSNGILFLAFGAVAFIVAFQAEVTALIQLYIVGVFVSFTLSQIGMVRHWTRLLRTETDANARGRMMRARMINTVGFVCTGTVLIIVVVTKFMVGAWIAILAMGVLFGMMKLIHKHYASVSRELELRAAEAEDIVLPSRNHAIVLVSNVHLPTLRALAYARATRPDVLEAITVSVDDAETRELVHKWEDSDVSVPLKVIASPYREITRPVLEYVKRVSKDSPRTVVTVFIPEYVVGHWWEQVLHNQSALRLKGRLLFEPNVMVTSVPWQLSSSERLKKLQPQSAPGDARNGIPRLSVDTAPDQLTLTTGAAANGGSCVARHDGRVVFVRYALPGETVRVRLIGKVGDRGSYWNAEVIEVLERSADRVDSLCPIAGVDGAGCCDLAFAEPAAARRLKGAVVANQLARLGGYRWRDELDAAAQPVGDLGATGWRTRVRLDTSADGHAGFHRYHSSELVHRLDCAQLPVGMLAGIADTQWPVDVARPRGGRRRRCSPRGGGGDPRRPQDRGGRRWL